MMSTSFIWENPGLALLGVLGFIFLILLFPIVAATKRSREERGREALRAREPTIYRDFHDGQYNDRYDDRYDDQQEDHHGRANLADYYASEREEQPVDRWSRRAGQDDEAPAGIFGSRSPQKEKPPRTRTPMRGIWFILGICVGIGGAMLWWNPPNVGALVALFERPDPPATPAASVPQAETKAQARFGSENETAAASTTAVSGAGGVGLMIDSFVASLKAQIPMSVGPGITMVSVNSELTTITLGFTIAQSVANEDAPKLQEELEMRFRDSVCATKPDPTNIHGLNDRGVAFLINYTDLLGKNVAGLTVKPKFCSNPA